MRHRKTPTEGLSLSILSIRTRLNLSQAELGTRLELNQTTISQYETGRAKPSAQQLVKLISLANSNSEREPLLRELQERYGIALAEAAFLAPTEDLSSAQEVDSNPKTKDGNES